MFSEDSFLGSKKKVNKLKKSLSFADIFNMSDKSGGKGIRCNLTKVKLLGIVTE